MKLAQRQLLIACLALLCSGAALANDPPKAEPPKADAHKDEHKDGKDAKEAKAEPPAEPDLPSKPYPKNASPKAFAPKGEPKKPEEAVAAKPADKPADKAADKPAEKAVAKAADKPAEKSAEKPVEKAAADKPAEDKHEPAHARLAAKKHKPAAHAAAKPEVDPELAQIAREAMKANGATATYQVQAGENLDRVIKKTMPNSPFSMDVMRQAFTRANPQVLGGAKPAKLRPGQALYVPGPAVLRQVVLGDPAPAIYANAMTTGEKKAVLHTSAPVVAPTIAATASELNPPIAVPRLPVNVASNTMPVAEVPPEEKKKWVRYP